ncbi:MAG: hypothetical protein WCR27_03945 [Eubacteriales bacterium]
MNCPICKCDIIKEYHNYGNFTLSICCSCDLIFRDQTKTSDNVQHIPDVFVALFSRETNERISYDFSFASQKGKLNHNVDFQEWIAKRPKLF